MNFDGGIYVKVSVSSIEKEGVRMRKLSVVLLVLALSVVILAAGSKSVGDVKQPVMPQRPIGGKPGPAPEQLFMLKKTFFGFEQEFIGWIYQNLPDVELKTQVKDIRLINGELFITVDAADGEYMIYIPPVMIKPVKLTVKEGDKIEVKGKKMVLKQGVMVIPEKLGINGKIYDIKELKKKFERFLMFKKGVTKDKPALPERNRMRVPEKP